MKFLITGANGFLGSNLVETIIEKKHQVLAISRNNFNLKKFESNIGFIEQTENNFCNYKSKILEFQPDVVIHYAWHGGNSYNDANSLDQFSVNIPMTASLLDVFQNTDQKPYFAGIGTFFEYGILKSKAKEDQEEKPQTYYGLAKTHAKTMTKMFCEQNGMRWCWIRPCYVYGTDDVSSRLLPKTIKNLLLGKEMLLDDCSTVIDYMHVKDFSEGVISLLKSKESCGVYNICSSHEYSLRFLLELISKNIPKSGDLIKFDVLPTRKGFNKYFCGSNDKIRNQTGWFPKISINDGLADLIQKTKKEINNEH